MAIARSGPPRTVLGQPQDERYRPKHPIRTGHLRALLAADVVRMPRQHPQPLAQLAQGLEHVTTAGGRLMRVRVLGPSRVHLTVSDPLARLRASKGIYAIRQVDRVQKAD